MNTHIHIHINRNTHTHQVHALLFCLISSLGAEITLIPKNQELYTHLSPKSGAACCCRWGGKQKVWAAARGRHMQEVLTASHAQRCGKTSSTHTTPWRCTRGPKHWINPSSQKPWRTGDSSNGLLSLAGLCARPCWQALAPMVDCLMAARGPAHQTCP